MKFLYLLLTVSLMFPSCTGRDNEKRNIKKESNMLTDSTQQYGYVRDFLKEHVDIIELKNANSALTLVPAWQGRVMTSTVNGDEGYSFGWINRELITSRQTVAHINAYGGEERLWLGPEGGQFSLFFRKGKSFIYDDWQTPDFMDTSPYELISASDTSAIFLCDVTAENFTGTLFQFRIEREVTLLNQDEIINRTGVDSKNLNYIAYKSVNALINYGDREWKKETGMLSIWMLGMFNPSPSVIVVIPFRQGDEKILGPVVNDNYFGKIPEDRLKISGNNIYFIADGKSRGKIGIPPLRSTGTIGSYDSDNNILTLLFCNLPEGETEYVNSSWEIQEDPYSGDALNSYNDGPLEDGSQMGPFYELETSSPAAKLRPGERLVHTQITMHLTGDIAELNKVSKKILGVTLNEISNSFK